MISRLFFTAALVAAGGGVFTTCAAQDSLEIRDYRLMTGISGSLTGATNWMGAGYQNMACNAFADIVYTAGRRKWFTSHAAHWELGFTKFRDSIWMKHSDLLRFQLLWSKESASARHAWTLAGRTQLFDSYYYSYDPAGDKTIRHWAGSLLNPAELEGGYGFVLRKACGTLNLAIATVRLRHLPAAEQIVVSGMAITRRGVVTMDYGCSAQAVILTTFGKTVDWYFNGRFFLNGTGPYNFNTDLLNRFTLKLWKIFQIRLESRLVYEPLFSRKLQYRNELLAGIFYDLRKSAP